MTTAKKLGIWMDHSTAHTMEFTAGSITTKTLELKPNEPEKEYGLGRNEKMVHNKEHHQQLEFYKKLAELIKNYEEVVLFGPTDAKVELFHILGNDRHFDTIKIKFRQADKMTENQRHALFFEALIIKQKKFFSKGT